MTDDATLSSVCVFCGSNSGNDGAFTEAARQLGAALAKREIRLVYGGGCVGLMGILADRVMECEGEVYGVIPRGLAVREVAHTGVTRLIVVDTMHQRKARMESLSDAFIALPGGYGTLEELLEITTWAQLGIHRKPIGILNVNGFYDPLQKLIEEAIDHGFIRPPYRDLLFFETEVESLLNRLNRFELPRVPDWLD